MHTPIMMSDEMAEAILAAETGGEPVRCAGCSARGLRLPDGSVINSSTHEIPALCLPPKPVAPHGPWMPA